MADDPEVTALFDAFLDRLEGADDQGAEAEEFEAFVRRHAEHEPALRSLHARWARIDAGLESALPESLVDESFFLGGGPRASVRPGPQRAATPGAVVAGDYRLLRLIAQGGMGQVWEAEQRSLSRRVALKLLRPGRHDHSGAHQLAREARAAGRLTHPGLVAVHAAGEDDGVAWIAQELVGDGFTLADWIERRRADEGPEPPAAYRHLAELFAQVADAVASAHEAGILHRDLKPSNILIGPDDRPRVSDFGLAHVADEPGGDARPGLLGTYPYMSPEQAGDGDDAIDGRSDVFSLGAVLYEALTLRRAFEGDTGEMILDRVRGLDPIDPRRLRSRVPEDLAVICLHALEKDRRKRYRGMAEMAADLRRFLDDQPILARPSGWRTRSVKWTRRHPAWTAAVVTLSAALLAISGLLVREVGLRREADEQTLLAELAGSQATLRAADLDLERGDHASARGLLDAVPESLRGWAWRHNALRADLSILRLTGHTEAITAVALSADGSLVASASDDGDARLWSGRDGAPLAVLSGHDGAVSAVAVSGDGDRIATAGVDGRVLLWDAAEGEPVGELPPHAAPVVELALTRDGSLLATLGADGELRLLELPSGLPRPIPGEISQGVEALDLASDGRHLATISRFGRLSVVALRPEGDQVIHGSYWRGDIAFHVGPDGDELFIGSTIGALLIVDPHDALFDQRYELVPGEGGVRALAGHAQAISHLASDDRRSRLVSASTEENALRIWSLRDGGLQVVLTGHDPLLTSLAVSGDGTRVAAGSSTGEVLVWLASTPDQGVTPLRRVDQPVTALAVSEDGALVVSGSQTAREAVVWDGRDGRVRAVIDGHPIGTRDLAVSGDGSLIVAAASDRYVHLWAGPDGAPLPHLVGHTAPLTSVATDGEGRRVASGSTDRTVRVWDPGTGHPVAVLDELGASVSSVAMSRSGTRLLLGCQDGSVIVSDEPFDTRRSLQPGTGGRDDGRVALSADGRVACWASADRDEIVVWEVDTGAERRRLTGPRRGLTAVALSHDGSLLLSAAGRDDVLRLRDTRDGRTLAALRGHEGPVASVAFSRGDERLVSGGYDQTVRIWESDKSAAAALWRSLDD